MAMRSAIHYPDTHLKSKRSMASALLLWDELKVITPWDGFQIAYHARDMAEAWELVGSQIVPNSDERDAAHQAIQEMIDSGSMRQLECPSDLRPDHEYEMYAAKLSNRTWSLLRRNGLVGDQRATGDYSLNQQAAMSIMAKLTDACAGDVFARVTDRLLAYGLIANQDETVMAHSHVVPMTLELIDAASIGLDRVIEFRQREAREQRGGDYRAWRHEYAAAVQGHIVALRDIQNLNQRDELQRQFRDDMERHLSELGRAIGEAKLELVLKPAVISVVAGAVGLATAGPVAAFAGVAAGPAIKAVADLFSAGVSFNQKQRNAMDKNPMAYMYQLARA